ncbi:hypothetical protein GCM10007147_37380 [Nocardiopsis kunsanensis]|uniref:Uncharacterized protein n=1 Tax=Nocardiopsis kunsanensis TaxID=141693 RepID=A0A919CKP8_9ACTN|nr:hypothetical protein GCM10007147_37380 [Nocardiopsis kunsanensis]
MVKMLNSVGVRYRSRTNRRHTMHHCDRTRVRAIHDLHGKARTPADCGPRGREEAVGGVRADA